MCLELHCIPRTRKTYTFDTYCLLRSCALLGNLNSFYDHFPHFPFFFLLPIFDSTEGERVGVWNLGVNTHCSAHTYSHIRLRLTHPERACCALERADARCSFPHTPPPPRLLQNNRKKMCLIHILHLSWRPSSSPRKPRRDLRVGMSISLTCVMDRS